jgi:outer membrane protein assembly factor BamE (lipoprotein component of BamABCDE complex)
MKPYSVFIRFACALAVASLLAGCVSYGAVKPGLSMAEVEQQLRAPTGKRTEPNGNQVWEYDLGPEGRAFWTYTFGADGRLIASKQWLSEETLRSLQPGRSTHDDVLRLIGKPVRKFNFTRLNEEVWDYRYVTGSLYMLAHVSFDAAKGRFTMYSTELDPEKYPGNDSNM